MRHLSLADTIWVAAAASSTPPEDLLLDADLTLLALLTARARTTHTVAEAAAELLVGVAAGRPFPAGNRAAAWAVAAHVATLNRRRLELGPEEALGLLDEVMSGAVDESQVAERLRPALSARPGRARRFLAAMWEVPPAPPTVDWSCPECGRTVPEPPHRSSAFLYKPLPDDVIRDCAARHRAHGPSGDGPSTVLDPLRRSVPLRRA